MATLQEIRQKYPQYNDMSDMQLADALHARHYSDIPKDEYYKRIGLQAEQPKQEPEPPFRERIMKSIQDSLKGGLIGGAQGLSDIGANIAQFPGDIYSAITGKEGYKAPRPDFRSSIPESGAGQMAGQIGEIAAPFALPVAGAEALTTKLIPRLLAGSGIGAAESEDRGLGALLGGALGGLKPAGKAISELPITQKMASKSLRQAEKHAADRGVSGLEIPDEILNDAQDMLSIPGLAPTKKSLENIISKAKEGGYKPLFQLQSNLGHVARQLSKSSAGSERLLGEEVHGLRNKLLQSMKSELQQQGHHDIAELMGKGQNKYRQYIKFKPYRNAAAYTAAGGLPGYQILKKMFLD